MTKPESKEASQMKAQDQALLKQLRALNQPAPSAELDAAILQEIESALLEEAKTKSTASAPSHMSQIGSKESPAATISTAPTWLERLRQWWYLPVAAMASLIISVNLLHTESVPSGSGNQTQSAAIDHDGEKKAEIDKPIIAQASSADGPSTVASSTRAAQTEGKSTGLTESEMTETKTQVAKADTGAALSKSKAIAAAEKPVAVRATPTVSAPPLSPTPPAITSDTMASNQQISVANNAAAPASSSITGQNPLQFNRDELIAAETPKQEDVRRISVTGSRIRAESAEKAPAVIAEETMKKPVSEVRITASAIRAAPPMPVETPKAIEPARPTASTDEVMLARPIAPMVSTMPQKKLDIEVGQARELSRDPKLLGQEIEQLLNTSRTLEALTLWREFKKQHPQHHLPSALEQRLKGLESATKQ